MPNLKRVQPPARYRPEIFNRELNAQLARSRASGSSLVPRSKVMAGILLARSQDPKALIAYVPPVPKILKVPGYLRARLRKPRPIQKPCRAEVDVLLTASRGHRRYARLTNGQIVKAFDSGADCLAVYAPVGRILLHPADIKQLAEQAM